MQELKGSFYKMKIDMNFDLFKLVSSLLLMSLFFYLTFRIVEPFLFGFFWSLMVVVTTWPILIYLQKKLFYSRLFATITMCIIIMIFFSVPMALILINISKNSENVITFINTVSQNGLPQMEWLSHIPLVGDELQKYWQGFKDNDGYSLIDLGKKYVPWFLEQMQNVGLFMVHCAVMLVFSSILYMKGEVLNRYLTFFISKLSSHYGINALLLVGKSISAVSLGIVVTAVFLATLGGITLALTSTPYAGFLTLVLFICCVVQIGPVLIMVLAIIWQYYQDDMKSMIILIICALILTTLDSLMRTLLIKKGVNLPFFLILFGVIGGLLAFGLMGLFLGPIMLSLTYNFINEWVREQNN